MIRKSIGEDTILFLEGNQKNIDLLNEELGEKKWIESLMR